MVKNKMRLKKRKILPKKEAKKKIDKKLNKKNKKKHVKKEESLSDSDVDLFSNPDKLHKLLEPCSKPQLVNFVIESALKDQTLFNRIKNTADRDESHRKIFIHGLGWDTTRETLVSAFQSDGEIEDCHVVTDRTTGKAKGYGFVLFKTRRGAAKALRLPRKKIGNRMVSCQLASIGPPGQQQQPAQDVSGRKIYVSNVQPDADPEKLLKFFAKFGNIESGPMGFDVQTGKSRGFALFVYKSQEGALNALEEPQKLFEGHQLQCQKAAEGKIKVPSVTQQPSQGAVLAAVAGAQNMMFSQYTGLNPVYGQFITAPPGLVPSNQVGQVSQLGPGLGGYNASVLGAYGSTNPNMGLQHFYQNPQPGLLDSAKANGTAGSLGTYPSYMR